MDKYAAPVVIYKYIRHQLSSSGLHGLHSPFIFELYAQLKRALHPDEKAAILEIERYRQSLQNSREEITFHDPSSGIQRTTTIGQIARRSAISAKRGQKLAMLSGYFQPEKILELGTSLGISAAFLRAFNSKAEFRSIEGNKLLSPSISESFQRFVPDGKSYLGQFQELLPGMLQEYVPDFCFIDGDHTYEATIHYVRLLLHCMPSSGVIVLDDIHWSAGMERAWDELRELPEVYQSIDAFFLGILFLNPARTKETFKVRW